MEPTRSTGFLPRALGVMIFFLLPGALLMSQSRHITPEELTRAAESVAIAQVNGITSEWDETGKAIQSRVTLTVSEYVKGGGSGSSLTVFVPGGEVGGVGEIYSHAPGFRRDESVVLFLQKDKQNRYRVAGGVQGKYLIEQDKVTGKPVVSGIIPLDQFKARIKNAAAPAPGGLVSPGR